MYSNKKIASVLLNASVNGSACRVAKIVSGLLLAVVLCANISLKGGDSCGEKRASEDSEGLMAIADASLGSEAVLRVSVVSALLSFRNAGANDIGGRPREAVGAVVVEGGVSEGVGSGKRKRNDTGGATGQPAAKRARDGEKPYVCDFEGCGYKTGDLSGLRQHKQMHSDDRRFKCTVCDYEAKRKSHLDNHVKTKHTTKKNLFSCDFEGCDYASNQMYSLKTHMIRHTGEKPYVCDFEGCDYASNQMYPLKTHMRRHTSEKPYVCGHEGCGYKTGNISVLRQHKQKHSNDRRFKCTVCDYEAKRKSHLDNHVKTKHTTKKNLFSCDFEGCDYISAELDILEQHAREHRCDFPECFYMAGKVGDVESHKKLHFVGTGLPVDGDAAH